MSSQPGVNTNPQSYEPLAGKFPQYNSVQIELLRRFLKGLEK